MCSAGDDAALPAPGLPIRESAGQRLFSASPRLIAAVHALHRLLVPRHPPLALTILTVIMLARTNTRGHGDTRSLASLCSSQGPRRGSGGDSAQAVSQNSTAGAARTRPFQIRSTF